MKSSSPDIITKQAYGERLEPLNAETYLEIDWERSEIVLTDLLAAYHDNEFPYNTPEARLPHDDRHLPEGIKENHVEFANYLFVSCYYMRGGIKSIDAFRRLKLLYEVEPDVFNPYKAKDMSNEKIALLLSGAGLGFQKRVANEIIENSNKLVNLYDGDPRNIFSGILDIDLNAGEDPHRAYEVVASRIVNDKKGGGFRGFQEKMASMIAYYLTDTGLIPEFRFPLPVDMHVFRVTAATGMIRFHGYNPSETPTLEASRNIQGKIGNISTAHLLDKYSRNLLSPNDKSIMLEHSSEINELWQGDNLYSNEALNLMRYLYSEYAQRHNLRMIDICNVVWLLSQTLCGQQPGNQTREPLGRNNRDGRSTLLLPVLLDTKDRNQQEAYRRSCNSCPLNANHTCSVNIPGKPYYVHGELYIRGNRNVFPAPPRQEVLSI